MVEKREKDVTILKGTIIHTPSKDRFECHEGAYLIGESGRVTGIFDRIPEQYRNVPVRDYGKCMIIPGLSDTHVHAPQFAYRGLGTDMQLMDWLNTYAFPTEAGFADMGFAETVYSAFADELVRNGTVRAVVFATLHVPATIRLMEILEERKIRALVGKVNMDTLSPDCLCETPEESLAATRRWLEETKDRFRYVKPAVTPRFIPTCSDQVLEGTGKLAAEFDVPIHSHISEDLGEMAISRSRHPEYDNDGDVYDHFGLLTDRTVMAHFLYPTEHELELIRDRGVTIACCAQSHGNVAAGIAKTRRMLDMGIKVGLGSDIAGGCSVSIFRAMSDALYMSKLRYLESGKTENFLTASEAFYLGTVGGGQLFGKTGCFLPGYEMDALVIDDTSLAIPGERRTSEERIERVIHLADDRNVIERVKPE
ncbi:MAG: amidohydrolase family protein [Lachnospiraceae bacterium]|nr:amidohydrolase family protein [Lachnospiraceae bacterium]